MKIVVKVGGSILRGPVPAPLVGDLKATCQSNQVAVVHGGGDTVTEIAERLGKEQRFVVSPDGIRSRYTDRETADIYTMVMSGLVAKKLVFSLQRGGVNAVSVTGADGALLRAKRKVRLAVIDERGRKVMIEGGYTGKVESVNSGIVSLLMSNGYVPVVSPVAMGEDCEPLNVDGDRAASALAVGIQADAILFLTNVEGLSLGGELAEELGADEAERRMDEIGYGMQKKVMAAVEAVRGGLKEAIICSGVRDSPISGALAHSRCTVIT